MLWEYIEKNFSAGVPILSSDIKINMSDDNKRQQLMLLVRNGKLRRYENGVFYIPKAKRLGGEAPMSSETVLQYKYISRNNRTMGYYSGFTFANQIGITTQMPVTREIVTNEIRSPIKKIKKDSYTFIIRKSRTDVNNENAVVLQFLDLLKDLYVYSELSGKELTALLSDYIIRNRIDKGSIDKFLPLFPEKIYKTIYETEIANVFTRG